MTLVSVKNLSAGYTNSHILFGVGLEAERERITVLVGPNGCGKSTLLKSIFGLTAIYGGSITYDGKQITGMAPHRVARKGIAYLPQTENVFASLTVSENITMAGYTLDGKTMRERTAEVFEAFPILERFRRAKAETLSGGQRHALGMGMALLRRPKLMLFDEPTASLAPKLADEVIGMIKNMRDRFNITVILVEQDIRRALAIGDAVYLLAGGKNVFDGTPEELKNRDDLARLYLGIKPRTGSEPAT